MHLEQGHHLCLRDIVEKMQGDQHQILGVDLVFSDSQQHVLLWQLGLTR